MALHTEHGSLRGLSLCAGYGGLDLGLHIAEPGYSTVGYVEREAHAASTLVARMADEALAAAPVWDDLRSFDGRPWRHRIHIISAGYPCQPFSTAGRRAGSADPRHLWPEVARIIEEVEPEWVFCENVEGHLDLGFADVVRDLQAMDFGVKAGLFTAREAGARHRRRRLFIMAHANSIGRGVLPRDEDQRGVYPADKPEGHRRGKLRSVFTLQRSPRMDAPVSDYPRAGAFHVADVPLFAPGPGELQTWSDLLDRDAGFQPAILRTSDGMADRMERTRGVGNGVCSLACALAWRTLKTDFLGGEAEPS